MAAVTDRPRRALGLAPAKGQTSFRIVEGDWEGRDSYGETRILGRRIVDARCEPASG